MHLNEIFKNTNYSDLIFTYDKKLAIEKHITIATVTKKSKKIKDNITSFICNK